MGMSIENQLFEAAYDAHEATKEKFQRFQESGCKTGSGQLAFRLGSLRATLVMEGAEKKNPSFVLTNPEGQQVALLNPDAVLGKNLATCDYAYFLNRAERNLHDYFDQKLKLNAYAPSTELTLEERYALLEENKDLLPCSQEKKTISSRDMDWGWFGEHSFDRLKDLCLYEDDFRSYEGTAHFNGDAFEFVSGLAADDAAPCLDICYYQRKFTSEDLSRETVQALFFDDHPEEAVYRDGGTIGGFSGEELANMSYADFKEATAEKIAKSQEYVFVSDKSAGLLQAKESIEKYLDAAIKNGVGVDKAMDYLQQAVDGAKEKLQHKGVTR